MADYPSWPNLAAMMLGRAAEWSGRPMLRAHRDNVWRSTTWGEFGAAVGSVARGLRRLGVAAGERVLIVSENRPEFPIAETALLAIRAVPVPAYTTNLAADHAHVVRDCGASAAIVSTAAHATRVIAAGVPAERVISMEPDGGAVPFGSLLTDGGGFADIAAEAAEIPASALACLIYTSGTGGAPKGVMLSHRAVLANCRGAWTLVQPLGLRDEVYLSFLPLSHSYEHTAGQFFLTSIGCEIVYARGLEHLAADMLAVRPTIMTVVPRILETIRARVLGQVSRQPSWRRALFHRAIDIGARRAEGLPVPLADRALDAALERLVRRKVRARFGGRFRAAMSGGARLEPDIARFFLGLGITLLQGYGQTEAGPVIAANTAGAMRVETVGRPLEGVEVRIAEDGEICVRGDLVMEGYWGQPEATAAVIRDGWLHTGDVGELDSDGYLRITDRKRDVIVLSGGENVSPARIEGLLTACPAIAQAVVAGDGEAGLTALLVPAAGHDAAAIASAVATVNRRLTMAERIRHHRVVEGFTIENGLLTATQKVRRQAVLRAHAPSRTTAGP